MGHREIKSFLFFISFWTSYFYNIFIFVWVRKSSLDRAMDIILLKLSFNSALDFDEQTGEGKEFVEFAQINFGELRAFACFNNRWKFSAQCLCLSCSTFPLISLITVFLSWKHKSLNGNWFHNLSSIGFISSNEVFIFYAICACGFQELFHLIFTRKRFAKCSPTCNSVLLYFHLLRYNHVRRNSFGRSSNKDGWLIFKHVCATCKTQNPHWD